MKKTLIASGILLSLIVFPAASEGNFTGFSAGLGIAAVGAEAKTSADASRVVNFQGADTDISLKINSTTGKRSAVGIIDLAYTQQFDAQWGIGLGVTYDLNKTKFGETALALDMSIVGESIMALEDHAKFEGKNHYSVYLQPFYAITPTTAFFAKIGYHSIKGSMTTAVFKRTTTVAKKMNGVGYGLGLRTLITDNLYAQVEANLVDYSKKTFENSDTSTRFKSTAGLVSIGYKF